MNKRLLTLVLLLGVVCLSLSARAAGGNVSLSFDNAPSQPFSVRVYTVDGKMLAEQIVTAIGANRYSIATPATSGICVVQIDSNEKGVTGSELIRF